MKDLGFVQVLIADNIPIHGNAYGRREHRILITLDEHLTISADSNFPSGSLTQLRGREGWIDYYKLQFLLTLQGKKYRFHDIIDAYTQSYTPSRSYFILYSWSSRKLLDRMEENWKFHHFTISYVRQVDICSSLQFSLIFLSNR